MQCVKVDTAHPRLERWQLLASRRARVIRRRSSRQMGPSRHDSTSEAVRPETLTVGSVIIRSPGPSVAPQGLEQITMSPPTGHGSMIPPQVDVDPSSIHAIAINRGDIEIGFSMHAVHIG